MPDELPIRIEDYLQFTPLVSVAPVRSVINGFILPRVHVPVPETVQDTAEVFISEERRALVLQRVLQRAQETRGTLTFRTTFDRDLSLVGVASRELEPQVRTLLDVYRSTQPPTTTTVTKYEDVHLESPHRPSTGVDAPSSIIAASREAPSQIAGSAPFAVEVLTPTPAYAVNGNSNSPSKRSADLLNLHDDESKVKRQRNEVGRSPSKVNSAKVSTGALLVDLKTERAAVMEHFQDFLDDIFEAEDNLAEDTSATSGTGETAMFETGRSEKCLAIGTIQKLLSLLRKALHIDSLTSIAKDDLVRIQRILMRSVTNTHSVQFKDLCHADQGDGSKQKWDALMTDLTSSMTASVCVVRILSAKHDHGDIYAEETLMGIVDNLKSVVEDVFLTQFAQSIKVNLPYLDDTRRVLEPLLQGAIAVLLRLTDVFRHLSINESITSRIIFMAVAAIFAEVPPKNNAICSINIIEHLKTASVTTVQCIYAQYPDQRQFVLDEVLSSLSKLPAGRQGTRQFKLANGKNIQLVVALLLHLVQSSTILIVDEGSLPSLPVSASNMDNAAALGSVDAENSQAQDGPPSILQTYSRKIASANHTARYIINFLLERSLKSAKSTTTEDAPFKALVDGFIEDFAAVLHLPEWPAAELMLRWISNSMIKLVDNPKQSAHVKVSAVDALCSIACKIRATTLLLRDTTVAVADNLCKALPSLPSLELQTSTTKAQIQSLYETQLVVFQYLSQSSTTDIAQRASLEYSVTSWIYMLLQRANAADVQKTDLQAILQNVANNTHTLHQAGNDAIWNHPYGPSLAHTSVARAYLQALSFYGLLQMIDAILPRLLLMMDHAQTTLRTKTMRSFARLSEIDPIILSLQPVQAQIALRLSDSSPQVRDVAIDLLGRYISANAHAGAEYYPVLRERIMDTGLSVRKRVLKLFKDLYLNNVDLALRSDIAIQLLHCLRDEEDSVQELSYKTLEHLWFYPIEPVVAEDIQFHALPTPLQQELRSRTAVISRLAANKSEIVLELLQQVLRDISEKLTDGKPLNSSLLHLFGQIFCLDVVEQTDESSKLHALIGTRALAQAVPLSFSGNQMETLLPYLQYGSAKFEQSAPFYVASTYASVLSNLTSPNAQFLQNVQSTILAQLTKLPIRILHEAVPALCVVSHALKDFSRVSKTLHSCLARVESLKPFPEKHDTARDKQAILLLHLIGLFGRHLQLRDPVLLKNAFEARDQPSFIAKLLSTIMPFVMKHDEVLLNGVSKAAIQSLGNLAVSNPAVFQEQRVLDFSDAVMNGSQIEAKKLLLQIYNEYLQIEQRKTDLLSKTSKEQPTKLKSSSKARKKQANGHVDVGVLTGDTDKFATDGISPSLMQRYLKQILNACLGLDLGMAITATKLVRSITTQGLANPRNCVPTIIALETSHNEEVRDIASKLHRGLNEKHESLIESCYIDGVKLAYRYQMRLNKNRIIFHPDTACINTLYDIVKASRKGRQKFLAALTKGLDINLDKLHGLLETDVKYAHFLAHNIACLIFITNEEVHIVIHAIDKILSTTGASLIQTLETEGTDTGHSLDQLGKAAAMTSYAMSLRNQLKVVYGISEAKCLAFDPTKLGNRSETKSVHRQQGVPLIPDWSSIHAPATAQHRRTFLLELFAQEEHLFQAKGETSDEAVEEQTSETDSLAHLSNSANHVEQKS